VLRKVDRSLPEARCTQHARTLRLGVSRFAKGAMNNWSKSAQHRTPSGRTLRSTLLVTSQKGASRKSFAVQKNWMALGFAANCATVTFEAGGLMSYGPNFLELYRRAADLVDKILRGAKPADIPVEQPTKFDFVINLVTAKALGLAVPDSLL